jgi:hypothetical protein
MRETRQRGEALPPVKITDERKDALPAQYGAAR